MTQRKPIAVPADALPEDALERRYIIRRRKGTDKKYGFKYYWNRQHNEWTSRSGATYFSGADRKHVRMPAGGKWVRVRYEPGPHFTIASAPKFVIRRKNVSNVRGVQYWNGHAWAYRDTAREFTETDRFRLDLPHEGKWEPASGSDSVEAAQRYTSALDGLSSRVFVRLVENGWLDQFHLRKAIQEVLAEVLQ